MQSHIFMGKTARDGSGVAKHRQQSMVLCDMDAPGVVIVPRCSGTTTPARTRQLFLKNVLAASILLGEGRGFEIAQDVSVRGAYITACV